MNQKILKALKGSIEKWEDIVTNAGEDRGMLNCPLCQLTNDGCAPCPVNETTNHMCGNTPYEKWINHHRKVHDNWGGTAIECKICERFAKQEVEFLKSLLPRRTK